MFDQNSENLMAPLLQHAINEKKDAEHQCSQERNTKLCYRPRKSWQQIGLLVAWGRSKWRLERAEEFLQRRQYQDHSPPSWPGRNYPKRICQEQ